jgi:hypothetical protein
LTDDALLVVKSIFGSCFKLLNSWYIPGTNVTPAVALFGLLFLAILFRIITHVFGLFGQEDEK